jgi:hypothetical protein
MKKDKILLSIIIAIISGVGMGLIIKQQINNRVEINNPILQNNTINTDTSVLPEVTTKSSLNDNKIHTNLIDGVIEKIYNEKPLKLDVKVWVYKFLPESREKDTVKTIVATDKTEYILHELASNKDITINPSDFNIDDTVAIWIVESNSDIFKLNQLTATKIIKFK